MTVLFYLLCSFAIWGFCINIFLVLRASCVFGLPECLGTLRMTLNLGWGPHLNCHPRSGRGDMQRAMRLKRSRQRAIIRGGIVERLPVDVWTRKGHESSTVCYQRYLHQKTYFTIIGYLVKSNPTHISYAMQKETKNPTDVEDIMLHFDSASPLITDTLLGILKRTRIPITWRG